MAKGKTHHKPLHKTYAETGRVPGVGSVPSSRTHGGPDGEFEKTHNTAQRRGALEGYASRTGKNK